jgi:hypothetical protein
MISQHGDGWWMTLAISAAQYHRTMSKADGSSYWRVEIRSRRTSEAKVLTAMLFWLDWIWIVTGSRLICAHPQSAQPAHVGLRSSTATFAAIG